MCMFVQEARLAECERMLVAIDLAMWLSDSSTALQAVVKCYGLLAPLIFHQTICNPAVQVYKKFLFSVLFTVWHYTNYKSFIIITFLCLCLFSVAQVLTKCLVVLEENSALLKQKWTGNTSESLMHMIACITYYLSKVCMHMYCMCKMYTPYIA